MNAYTLMFGGFLLLGGRMADLLGRRRMFMLGLVVFSLASLAGGLAQSEMWLIAARTVQGLGAAIVSPAALSIITTTFADGAERNRALGIWGAVAGAGGAAGVLLGGILTSGLSWRWVLFVNVPVGLLAAALAPRTLGESRREEAGNSFDIPGAMAVTGGLALLVYAVVDAPQPSLEGAVLPASPRRTTPIPPAQTRVSSPTGPLSRLSSPGHGLAAPASITRRASPRSAPSDLQRAASVHGRTPGPEPGSRPETPPVGGLTGPA